MNRLTINLTNDQFNKIKTHAENKSMSLSYYGSTLLDIGLRVEQAAAEKTRRRYALWILMPLNKSGKPS